MREKYKHIQCSYICIMEDVKGQRCIYASVFIFLVFAALRFLYAEENISIVTDSDRNYRKSQIILMFDYRASEVLIIVRMQGQLSLDVLHRMNNTKQRINNFC